MVTQVSGTYYQIGVNENGLQNPNPTVYQTSDCSGQAYQIYLPSADYNLNPFSNYIGAVTNVGNAIYTFPMSGQISFTPQSFKSQGGACIQSQYQSAEYIAESSLILVKDFSSNPLPWVISAIK
jgi:hypothetical protein